MGTFLQNYHRALGLPIWAGLPPPRLGRSRPRTLGPTLCRLHLGRVCALGAWAACLREPWRLRAGRVAQCLEELHFPFLICRNFINPPKSVEKSQKC